MRHGKKINHLGRTDTHRKAMLANMASSLIMHKRINTTVAKAKALRVYVEPLLTKAKNDTTHSRRTVFTYLQSKESVTELFREVAVKIADRPGGYTRIIKTGTRLGDNAEMCFIELVDYNELYVQGKGEEKKEKTTRRGRGSRKKSTATAKPAAATTADKAADAAETAAEASAAEVKEAAADKKAVAAEKAEEAPVAETPASEEAKPASEEITPEAVKATPEAEGDDLKKIEGIGPKIAEVLQSGGITSFALLAEKSEEELNSLLSEAGDQFASHNPATWPKQAELAAAGKWDELKKLQDELQGGREDKKEG